jgi:hypothetical protein
VDGRYIAKPCDHRRVKIEVVNPIPLEIAAYEFAYDLSPYQTPMRVSDCEALCDYVVARASDLARTVHRLQTEVMMQFPPTIDLGTFLLEGKESLELFPKLFESWANWLSFAQRKRSNSLPSIGDMLSSNHLAAQFGMIPLVSDLEAIAGFSAALIKRIESLRKWNGKVTQRHARQRFTVGHPAIYDSLHGWFPGQVWGLDWLHGPVEVEVGVSALLHCNLEGLGDWTGVTIGALAQAGLNNPLGIVWEAIPFSFVADWVANIGDRLKRAGATPIAGEWSLTDWCWSARLKRTSQLYYAGYLPTSVVDGIVYGSTFVNVHHANVVQEVFLRDTVFPGFSIGLPLTAGQAGLALALLIQSMS